MKAISWKQKPFPVLSRSHWDKFWPSSSSDKFLLNLNNRFACDYPLKPSELTISLSEQILISTNISSEFTTLHIRRGDSVRTCDTTIKKIMHYLECSLKSCSKNLPVLFFTDEIDQIYVGKVEQILENLNHTVFNGEKIISEFFENSISSGKIESYYDNNFFRFQISNYIKSMSKYQLVQRRSFHCNSCDHVCVDNTMQRRKRSVWSIQKGNYMYNQAEV